MNMKGERIAIEKDGARYIETEAAHVVVDGEKTRCEEIEEKIAVAMKKGKSRIREGEIRVYLKSEYAATKLSAMERFDAKIREYYELKSRICDGCSVTLSECINDEGARALIGDRFIVAEWDKERNELRAGIPYFDLNGNRNRIKMMRLMTKKEERFDMAFVKRKSVELAVKRYDETIAANKSSVLEKIAKTWSKAKEFRDRYFEDVTFKTFDLHGRWGKRNDAECWVKFECEFDDFEDATRFIDSFSFELSAVKMMLEEEI